MYVTGYESLLDRDAAGRQHLQSVLRPVADNADDNGPRRPNGRGQSPWSSGTPDGGDAPEDAPHRPARGMSTSYELHAPGGSGGSGPATGLPPSRGTGRSSGRPTAGPTSSGLSDLARGSERQWRGPATAPAAAPESRITRLRDDDSVAVPQSQSVTLAHHQHHHLLGAPQQQLVHGRGGCPHLHVRSPPAQSTTPWCPSQSPAESRLRAHLLRGALRSHLRSYVADLLSPHIITFDRFALANLGIIIIIINNNDN